MAIVTGEEHVRSVCRPWERRVRQCRLVVGTPWRSHLDGCGISIHQSSKLFCLNFLIARQSFFFGASMARFFAYLVLVFLALAGVHGEKAQLKEFKVNLAPPGWSFYFFLTRVLGSQRLSMCFFCCAG